MVVLVVVLFVLTYSIDRVASQGAITLPDWMNAGGPDAARQVLIAIAAAVITVAGVVFSITILVLQLASQQFGPRMLRAFIRDTGTQVSIGAYVATFVYAILVLQAVQNGPTAGFVPHLSVDIAVSLTMVNIGVLIYFINHVADSIQLTTVVAGIAQDFQVTLADVRRDATKMDRGLSGSEQEQLPAFDADSAPLLAQSSGFVQAVAHRELVAIAVTQDAVIRFVRRPGHFVVQGEPIGVVSPAAAAADISHALTNSHMVGSTRTLTQDPIFAIDQLVEIAVRALSPAVNDTFTALNCIDWLGACLCRAAEERLPDGVYRDSSGTIRLIEPVVTLDRLVKGATDKIRQAGTGMPPIYIRQLENFIKLMAFVQTPGHRAMILRHADMILAASERTVAEEQDRGDVLCVYEALVHASGVGVTVS